MAAKRFKLRLSKVITSFNSCRSKDAFTLPFNSIPSLHSPTTTPPLRPPPNPHRSSLRHHVSSALISVGCGIKSSSTLSEEEHTKSPPETFHWKKENDFHVVAKAKLYYDETTPRRKIYSSSDNDILPPPPPTPSSPLDQKKKRRTVKKKKTTCRFRTSTSSAESGLFSAEETETETETLVSSSRSFSTDSSSEFNPHLKTIREATVIDCSRRSFEKMKRNRRKRSVKKGAKRCVSNKTYVNTGWSTPQENETEARLSVFQRMIPCTVDGKMRESYAVVKKSKDPYEDFKRSMIEMILEKQMFDDEDLEKLLQCFLSLNSRRHHGVIVQAFTEIWELLFCSTSSNRRVSRTDLEFETEKKY